MPIGVIIGISSSSLIFFILSLVFSIFNYKKRFALKYDLKNHFPYELNYKSRFKDNLIGNLCLVMAMVLSLSSFACCSPHVAKFNIIIAPIIAGSLYSLVVIFVFFADIKYLYFHVLIDVLLAGFGFLTPGLLGLMGLFQYQQNQSIPGLVYLIIGLIVGIFNFALIMNPRFSFNIKMRVVKLDSGEEQVERPKIIVMAFSEWMMIFSLFISHILLILILFIL